MTCFHNFRAGIPSGLCRRCRADREEDPAGYDEFGDHPQGRENYRVLLESIADGAAAQDPTPPEAFDGLPF